MVELGVATSHLNGGVLSVDETLKRLNARRRPENKIAEYVLNGSLGDG